MGDKHKLGQWLGTGVSLILVVVSLLFIGQRLNQQWSELSLWRPDGATLITLCVGIITYGMACLCLSYAWRKLLCSSKIPQLPSSEYTRIYARSQIGKYIPGNIFHIAGRHALGLKAGIGHRPLAYAAIAEMIGLMSAAMTVAISGGGVYRFFAPRLNFCLLAAVVVIVCIVFLLLFRYKPQIIENGYRAIVKSLSPGTLSAWVFSYLAYIGFFLVAGITLLALVMIVSDTVPLHIMPSIVGSFSIAWAAGFLTPGAPSGIGVREAILVLALESTMTQADAILVAILFRSVTVLGDVVFLLLFGNPGKKGS